ncbi:AAA family ATPase [Thiocapsa marina]|uniref:Adenylate/guanylate cyclase with GAF sensor(S) n=1 Tax=Thiocapsa marina 5811 TaxID=768671 RepID=F9U5X2_9GAMM|nr:AAA family ATPase [Thiocapsa marina]EGV20545.1 adenylate/guanylate cyclase with GAF sensor(s) [Thiocapsa marina 5811]
MIQPAILARAAPPTLLDPIRRGQTFTVYRGRLADGQAVICKTVSGRRWTPDAIARLENEYAITRGLTHPGQIAARALIRTDNGPMLVSDDQGDRSLDTVTTLPLPPETVARIAVELARILADLHQVQGIVHRDIKPSNLIVDEGFNRVRLIDYCLAIRATDLAEEPAGAFAAKGTLAYMAPEQSGRMNRQVDWRADLYAFGILLYELLTGRVPFADPDPATLIHRHLTEIPPAPRDLCDAIPLTFSDAVMRLIRKNPEDRFQTATDFINAVERADDGVVPVPSMLRIPDRLYGREAMIERLTGLMAGPDQSQRGGNLLRIAGQSGIGKSALVERLVAPIAAAGGHFIQGKFDQTERARPYAPFVQAFNALLRSLLAGTSEQVDAWRAHLLDALSPNARVVLDLLPGYETLLGPQPPVAKLGLNEAQIRMSLVFRRFVGALARADSPLVIFIDDLQWSDSASRSLIELLLTDTEIRHLTILTAYRDNEIGAGHPVAALFASLEEKLGLPPAIEVGPLGHAAVSELLADALGHPPAEVEGLAARVVAKTGGNPFFVQQFLRALQRKGLLLYDSATWRWQWDLAAVDLEQITDNVADLVIERILELPAPTREMVQIAACHGNLFETEILGLAAERDPSEIVRLLAPALAADILLSADDEVGDRGLLRRYRFQHDRVQQAAHDLLSRDLREQIHARIGALLLEKIPDPAAVGRLTEITDHLIAGQRRLDHDGRRRLRDLALQAARLTKSAIAYDAALQYLDVADAMLGEDAWLREPDLAFEIALEKAQAAYLQDRTDLAEEIAEGLLGRGRPALDQVRVLGLMVLLHTSRMAYGRALDVGLRALALLGEKLPRRVHLLRVLAELASAKLRLAGRTTLDLAEGPRMQDPRKLAAMQIMVLLAPPAYFSAPNLLPLIALRMVQMSVRYGNAPESAYAYVLYGMLHCAVLADPVRGLAYGDLARQLAVDLDARDLEGRILMIYAGFIQHWSAPLVETLPIFLEGAEKAISAGDLEHHGYHHYGHASYAFMGGLPLAKVSDYLESHQAAEGGARHEKTRRIMRMAGFSIARMRGLEDVADRSDDERESEDESFAVWTEQRDATSLAYFHKYRMLDALMREDFREVLARAHGMRANLNGIVSMAFEPFYQFYEALALIELGGSDGAATSVIRRTRAWRLTRRLERWARYGPDNFAHRALLLRAELAAADGRSTRAMELFDAAVAAARRAGALQDVGLFLERAARFYLGRGARTAAAGYLCDAVDAFDVWGANAWSKVLTERYADLVQPRTGVLTDLTETGTSSSGHGQIVDSATLIRAAAALARKVSLNDVVTEVMRAMVINAGATRGVLLLDVENRLQVAAVGDANGEVRLLPDGSAVDLHGIPTGLVSFVRRARERVVMDDACADPTFRSDPHIRAHAALSILCVPLLSKGDVVGMVYLENAGVRGAFSADRCVTVETLGAQAAVSIENARLYDSLRSSLERQAELTFAHARFVPHQFLETLGRPSIGDIKLGDHVLTKASILFSDIRGFTSLLEGMAPVDAIQFINTYLSRMEPAVLAEGGFIDNYVGDAIMAVFDRGADASIRAGIAMLRSLGDWARTPDLQGQSPIRIGVGIATGEMIFGTIGAANRLKCGVVGDTVNLAARIEGLTKHYGLGLLIGGNTYASLDDPERYLIREIDLVTVAGREAPVRLYEVFDADPEPLREQKLRTREALSDGLRLYRAGDDDQATRTFGRCRDLAPDDPLPLLLTERCGRNRACSAGPARDGIERIGLK